MKKKIVPIISQQTQYYTRSTTGQKQTYNQNKQQEISQININNGQKKIQQETQIKICNICLERESVVKIGACSHKFCVQCLKLYIQQRVKDFEKIKCCSDKCNKMISTKYKKDSQYIYYYLSQQMKNKVKQNKQFYKSIRDKTTCKRCFKNKQKGQCNCQQLMIELPPQIKQCPECKNWIYKQKGCNHMKCKCDYQFCFDCGIQWQINHICEHKIPHRQGISLFFCCIVKIFASIILFLVMAMFLIFTTLSICLVSGIFYGFFIVFKLLQKLRQIQNSCCQLIAFFCIIIIFPAIWILLIIPGLFIPMINICIKETIFLDSTIMKTLCETSLGCLYLVKLI